jgi:transposase
MNQSTHVATVGLDVSEQFIYACEISADGVVEESTRFKSNRSRLNKLFGNIERRRIVLEVGSHSRWIAEELTALGHEVLVLDPRQLKLISGSVYKDDRLDAERLAMLGQDFSRLLKVVKLRGLEHQRALTLVRARASNVKCRTLTINAIRGLLKPYGIRIPKEGRTSSFVSYAREEVPDDCSELIEPLLVTLETLNKTIKDYDKAVEAMLPKLAPDAMHLLSIRGVSSLTALYFVALVGDPYRFAKTRDIGSYFGLCRRRDDSGKTRSELGITKAGDPYMRALLCNAASHILGPFGQDCDLRDWGEKKAGTSRTHKRIAKVAVARKLSVLMLAMWKSGLAYEPRRNPTTEPA